MTAPQYDPRWISESLLSVTKPDVEKGFVLPAELQRADLAALTDKPMGSLSGEDVIALRRFAANLLETRQCRSIEDGDESVNRAGQIYVLCGDMTKRYADKTKWIN